jgi:hypothetical protein
MIAKLKGPVLGIGPFHVAHVASFFPLVSMSLKGELSGCHTQTWQPFFPWLPEFWFKYCYINSDCLPQSSHSKVRGSASSSAMKTVVADGLRVPRLGAKENPGAKTGAFGLESSVSALVKARQPRP